MNDNIICGECYRVEALDVWLRFSLVERGAVLRKRGGGGANNYTMRGTRGAVATGGCAPPSRAVQWVTPQWFTFLPLGFPLLECGPTGPLRHMRSLYDLLTSRR
jgi:hypothetical protein